jgi:hypothetical protein
VQQDKNRKAHLQNPNYGGKKMNVLDLGCGTGSATVAFRAHGHRVIGVDHKSNFADIQGDWCFDETWAEIDAHGPYDFVWFSPDCSIFSMAGLGGNEVNIRDGVPISERAKMEVAGIKLCLEKIAIMRPNWGWIMENPRGLMRTMQFVQVYHRVTVSYCQYGDTRQKPTDLFGQIPASFRPKMCRQGSRCHTPAPRGSSTGTQGMSKEEAGMVPYGLSLEIYKAVCESQGTTYSTLEDFL